MSIVFASTLIAVALFANFASVSSLSYNDEGNTNDAMVSSTIRGGGKRRLQSPSFLTGSFTIVKANQLSTSTSASVYLGNYTNGATINLRHFKPYNISMFIHTLDQSFSKVELSYNGKTRKESTAPYALAASSENSFKDVTYLLSPGVKTVNAKAYYGTKPYEEYTYTFTMFDSSLSSPTAPTSPIVSPTIRPVRMPSRSPMRKPTSKPILSPTSSPADLLLKGTWKITDRDADITARHEACFVMVDRVAVLIGGYGIRKPNIYNPIKNTWKEGKAPPGDARINHMQCVVVNKKVWMVAAWEGGFPRNSNAEYIYIYDPFLDRWETKPAMMPERRRRGSAAVMAIGELVYVAFGNRGGHEQANFAVSLPYFDVYNTTSGKWKELPDANFPRDHVGGGLVNGRFCVGGGRDGGKIGWPVVAPTECFDFTTQKWDIEMNVLQTRAGASYGTSCDGKLLMAGGEGNGKAYPNFDMFDGTKWTRLADLNLARHGTGLAVDCVCNKIYIASGNLGAGGGKESTSVETFSLDSKRCFA